MIDQLLIRNLEKPLEKNSRNDIKWVCKSFGFYETIDKKKTAASIFKRILDRTRVGRGISTNELGEELSLSRVSSLNHINRLIAAGLIIRDGSDYRLRSPNLQRTIKEMKRDANRIFDDILEIARDIDEGMLFKKRE